MPRDPNKRQVEGSLTKDEHEAFTAYASERLWSNKKLLEIIVRAFLRSDNKDEIIELGKKES